MVYRLDSQWGIILVPGWPGDGAGLWSNGISRLKSRHGFGIINVVRHRKSNTKMELHMSSLKMHRQRMCFTLIELLVVISIIALLISIVLPALKEAKRHVLVLKCLSNLKQLGIGLAVYTAENDNRFPPDFTIVGNLVSTGGHPIPGPEYDSVQVFSDIAGGSPHEVYDCPLTPYDLPRNSVRTEYLMLLIYGRNFYNWEGSGNPDRDGDGKRDGPYEPGYSDMAIIADGTWYDPNQCKAIPCQSNHGSWQGGNTMHDAMMGLPFKETNVLYSDGHGETHGKLEYYSLRIAPPNWQHY